MKNISFLTIAFIFCLKASACLNGESYMLKNRNFLYEDYESPIPNGHHFWKENFEQNLRELDSLYNKTKDVGYLSDKGLIFIIQKKYSEALAIYQSIEKTNPGRYSTASNMGTLYELMGDDKQALYWIKRSVEIEPNSHEGSEWLHVRILEAKLQGADTYNGLFLLGADFGMEALPVSKLSKAELPRLERSLFFQLTERMSFIQPEDPIVATLLFELANIKLILKKNKEAAIIYNKAQEYGYNGTLLNKRITAAGGMPKTNTAKKEQESKTNNLPIIIGSLSGIIVVAAAARSRNKRQGKI